MIQLLKKQRIKSIKHLFSERSDFLVVVWGRLGLGLLELFADPSCLRGRLLQFETHLALLKTKKNNFLEFKKFNWPHGYRSTVVGNTEWGPWGFGKIKGSNIFVLYCIFRNKVFKTLPPSSPFKHPCTWLIKIQKVRYMNFVVTSIFSFILL